MKQLQTTGSVQLASNVGVWLLTIVLTLSFATSGLHKLIPAPNVVESFQCWGYPDWFRSTLGLFEIAAAFLLLVPKRASYAAAFLSFVMLGSIATHLRWQEYALSVQPIFVGMFCVVLMFLRRDKNVAIPCTMTAGESR